MKNKLFYTILYLFFVVSIQGQNIGTWKSYLAYQNATIAVKTPNHIYAVYDGSLLSYSLGEKQTQTYSKEDGLNDIDITHLYYCSEIDALLIIYANSNVDIFKGRHNVHNLPNIKDDKDSYRMVNKKVNSVSIEGTLAYLSTGYGITVIDFKRKEIKGTYTLGVNTTSACQWENDSLYAATDNGYKRASLFSNLSDIGQWEDIDTSVMKSKVIEKLKPKSDNESLDIIKKDVQINSPLKNLCSYITYSSGKLFVMSGKGSDANRTPGLLMIYENGKWTNISGEDIAQKTGLKGWWGDKDTPWCRSFVSIAIDPSDSKHYFVASFGEGIYEFQDMQFYKFYTSDKTPNANTSNGLEKNSGLQTIYPDSSFAHLYVWMDGLAYDKNHNLYATNALVPNGLVVYTNKDKWLSFYYPPLSHAYTNQLLITRNNLKWANIYRGSSSKPIGIFVLNDNNTVDNVLDDRYYYSERFIDQQGRDIGATDFSCMAEDLSGIVWVGTDNGPIYFTSFEQVNRGECNRVTATDINGNGYYLLGGQKVSTIAVDGGNRKWVGTQGGGIFVIDQSGENAIATNFNTNNSAILSDNINSIAIDNETGEVFIATDKGICSYMGEATGGKLDYSNVDVYPNPIHPTIHSQAVISGLMNNSDVKITDLAGNLIREGISNGGRFVWNCTNSQGEIVKAGIYLVFASLPNGSQGIVTKIMVIK